MKEVKMTMLERMLLQEFCHFDLGEIYEEVLATLEKVETVEEKKLNRIALKKILSDVEDLNEFFPSGRFGTHLFVVRCTELLESYDQLVAYNIVRDLDMQKTQGMTIRMFANKN